MDDDTPRSPHEPPSDGWDALARGAWEEARLAFEATLSREETANALEGLGWAAWWLNDAPTTFDARERAYRLYRAAGDRRGAARLATCLATDHFTRRGEHAVASGWVQRAHRLLSGLDPGPEQAMLAIWEGHMALMVEHDTAAARRLSAEAAALAGSLGAVDLEMLAQALHGFALVSAGEVEEGMRLLDEATAAAVGGDMSDLDAITTTCCYLIYACECVRDYGRAAQWCDKVIQLSARWSYRLMFSLCRTHYAGVLIWRGAWSEAETQLTAATDELAATHPAMAVEGIVRLAELRRRQGRFAEAVALLGRLDDHPLRMLGSHLALLGRAALALDQDDATTATELAERYLRGLPAEDRLERVAGLELLVRAQAARGDLAQATDATGALRSIATEIATLPLRGSAAFCEGVVALAGGDDEAARRRFEDAVDLFERSGAPYESARSRLELAGVLAALGRVEAAEREARAAHLSLERMGAARETGRAAALIRRLEAARRGAAAAPAALTQREREVLRLVAQGLSDKEIAEALGLSDHTVHRHMSNVLAKLALPSRAAAVAHAAQHGLL